MNVEAWKHDALGCLGEQQVVDSHLDVGAWVGRICWAMLVKVRMAAGAKQRSPVFKQRAGNREPHVDACGCLHFWRLSVWGVVVQGGLEQTTGSPPTEPWER